MIKHLLKLYSIFDRREKINFFVQIVVMVLASLLEVIGVGIIPLFLVLLSSPEKIEGLGFYPALQSTGLFDSLDHLLVVGTVSLGIFFLLKNAFLLFVSYLNSKFLMYYKFKLEKKLYTAYLYAPYVFHLSNNSATLLSNLNSEIRVIILNVLMPLFKFINFGLLTISIVVLLLITEPVISIVIFLLLGGTVGLFLHKIRKKIREYGQEEQSQRAVMLKWLNQSFGGLKDIRILSKESYFRNRFINSIERTAKSSLYNQIVSNIPKPMVETVAVFAMLGIIFFLMSKGQTIESIVSVLVLFGAAFIRLMPAIQAVASNYSSVKYSSYAIDPIYDHLHLLRNVKHVEENVTPMPMEKSIQLKNISYIYPGTSRPVLNDINVKITAGSSIAFVGASGSGKTTLVDILMGLLEPNSGEVLVDGRNIKENPVAWFRNIGYVPQTIYLIDDTIRRNIALGVEDADIDEARIAAVIEEAQLSEFLDKQPDGLNTKIGERGVRLSGGQRQRIGIARALYHNPQVLVLDEATSALDNVVESYIIEAIERFKRKRTIIMIAHRLTTVKKCDELFYMSNGRIVNTGTFESLVEINDDFKKIALM